jgi:ethanolamine ammonia-lyase small subunit
VKANQAAAREAVRRELDFDLLRRVADFRVDETAARNKDEHLNDPRLGARPFLSTEAVHGVVRCALA